MAQKRQHSPSTSTARAPPLHRQGGNGTTTAATAPAGADVSAFVQDEHKTEQQGQGFSIFQSSSINDRSSKFTAIFSPAKEYLAKPMLLQRHEPFRDADHRMLASRRKSNQKALTFSSSASSTPAKKSSLSSSSVAHQSYTTWSDDDGEKYAGKKLEKVLNDLDVEGVIVVARWWGGVMLGPVRFEHIANVAKGAVLNFKRQAGGRGGGGDDGNDDEDIGGGKRVKLIDGSSSGGMGAKTGPVVDEAKEKEKLIRILNERDTSVEVLRTLLNDKNVELRSRELQISELASRRSQVEDVDTASSATVTASDTATASAIATGISPEQQEASHGDVVGSLPSTSIPSQSQPPPPSAPAPSTKIDYSSMPLQRLQQLERARDASLAWILKQIDATEIKIKDAERTIKNSGPRHSVLG